MISKFTNKQLFAIIVSAVVLLFPMFPVLRATSLSGHPWKVELLVFLILSFVFAVLAIKRINHHTMSPGLQFVRTTLAVFVLWSGTSVFWAASSKSVFHHTAVWAAYLFVFSMASWFLARKDGLRITLGFTLFFGSTIAVLTIFGYLQVIVSPTYEPEFRVAFSKYSEILVLLSPFFLVIGATSKRKVVNPYSIAAFLSFTAILFSLSRASFVSVIAGYAAALLLLVVYKQKTPALKRAGVTLLLFAGIFVFSQVLTSSKADITLLDRFTSEDSYQTSSNDIRRLLIGVSTEMVGQNPFFGIGADNFGLALNRYRAQYAEKNPNDPSLAAGEEQMLERAHNEYLQIFAELGLIGFVLFAGILISAGLAFGQQTSASRIGPYRVIRLAAAAGVFAFLVSSLFSSFSFRAMQNGIAFILILSLAVCSFRSSKSGETVKGNRFVTTIPPLLFCLFATLMFGFQATSTVYTIKAEGSPKFADALKAYSQAELFDSTNAAIDWSFGSLFFGEKITKGSAVHFRSAIDKGAGVISAYHYLAVSQKLEGDMRGATETMRECVSIYPQSVYARVFLWDLLIKQGEVGPAELQLKKAQSIDGKSTATWKSVFEKGTLETSIAARTNKELIPLSELRPNSVVLAVLGTDKLYEQSKKDTK